MDLTFLTKVSDDSRREKLIFYGKRALDYLENRDIVENKEVVGPGMEGQKSDLICTRLGNAIFRSSFSPDEGVIVYEELALARDRLILKDDLHAIYLVTPLAALPVVKPDFEKLFAMFRKGVRLGVGGGIHNVLEALRLGGEILERWSVFPPGPEAAILGGGIEEFLEKVNRLDMYT